MAWRGFVGSCYRDPRSANLAGSGALSQVRLCWLVPIRGGMLGGVVSKWLGRDRPVIVGNPAPVADGASPRSLPPVPGVLLDL